MIFLGLGVVLLFIGLSVFFWRRNRKKKKIVEASQKVEPASALQKTELPPVTAEPFKPELGKTELKVQPKVESKEDLKDEFTSSKTLKQALSKTEENLWGRIRHLFSSEVAQKNIDDVEEVLYTSDLGPKTVELLMKSVQAELSRGEKNNIDSIKNLLRREFQQIFEKSHVQEPGPDLFSHLNLSGAPSVWLVVGVNGVGKTTTIGKLAAHLAKQGKKVLVAAGDTFRAAAGSQLKVWTDRAQVEIFSPPGVTDPSAVGFDAVQKAKAQNYDVVIVDTAGRLHTQVNLMEELKKLKRVLTKVVPEAPHEVLIVLDANSGQNALAQAREFHSSVQLTGVVLTKMDGTAKGGVAVGLANELQIPIRLIGVGEKIGDLRAFSTQEFVDSIL